MYNLNCKTATVLVNSSIPCWEILPLEADGPGRRDKSMAQLTAYTLEKAIVLQAHCCQKKAETQKNQP